MRNLIDWINTPVGGAVLMWILTQAAATMPPPKPGGSPLWLWAYGLVQVLLANAEKSGIRIVASPQAATPPAPPVPPPANKTSS